MDTARGGGYVAAHTWWDFLTQKIERRGLFSVPLKPNTNTQSPRHTGMVSQTKNARRILTLEDVG